MKRRTVSSNRTRRFAEATSQRHREALRPKLIHEEVQDLYHRRAQSSPGSQTSLVQSQSDSHFLPAQPISSTSSAQPQPFDQANDDNEWETIPDPSSFSNLTQILSGAVSMEISHAGSELKDLLNAVTQQKTKKKQ